VHTMTTHAKEVASLQLLKVKVNYIVIST
jgi:hypothetical protein